jgi:hypothetical protein
MMHLPSPTTVPNKTKRRRVTHKQPLRPPPPPPPFLRMPIEMMSAIVSFLTMEMIAHLSGVHSSFRNLFSKVWIQSIWFDSHYHNLPPPSHFGIIHLQNVRQVQLDSLSRPWHAFLMHHIQQAQHVLPLRKVEFGFMETSEICAVLKQCPQLKSVEFNTMAEMLNDDTLKCLGSQCPQVQHLTIEGACNVTEAGFIQLASYCSLLTQLKLFWCFHLTDDCMKAFAKYCLQLRELDCVQCSLLTDEGIEAIVTNCTRLDTIDVSFLKITDQSLIAIGRHCPHLKEASFMECTQITDQGIHQLVKGCRHLKSLNILNCHQLTDETLFSLSQQCPQLTDLNISYNSNITEKGVDVIWNGCPQMYILDVSHCRHISTE